MKDKKLIVLLLAVAMAVVPGIAMAREVRNPDTMICASIGGGPESLDPAWSYDTSSAEVIFNIYDTLIFFKGEHADKFMPLIATEVPTLENGLISEDGLTYIFPIRKGVKFHNGDELTPEDVEYTFERMMVQDRSGGPLWMFYEPLLGIQGSRDNEGNITVDFADIDNAIEVQGDNVVFHLEIPYPPFLGIIANAWAGIVSKRSVIEYGGWPGTAETWKEYNDPDTGREVLHARECGSGPYELVRWEAGKEVVMERFDDYWRGPARTKTAVIKYIDEWSTRKLMLLAGDVDIARVYAPNYPEMEGASGIECVKDLPTLTLGALFFNFDINPDGNPDIGSGKLDGKGIPPDFFSDIDVRKGFAYAFDYDTFIEDAFMGEALKPISPIVDGLPYRNPEQEAYLYDRDKAIEHFKNAWDGAVWENGFKFTLMYNTGNVYREIGAMVMKDCIESLNPKFDIEIRPVDWPVYLRELVQHRLTLYIVGWLADYPDPHNFVHPFMHSRGTWGEFQSYDNPRVDELIDKGVRTVDPAEREEIYYELQRIYYEDVPSICVYQEIMRHYRRDWVKGWYYNPIFPSGVTTAYFYDVWKE